MYPFTELAKNKKSVLTDKFKDQLLTIEFDAENRDGLIKNSKGEIVPSINTFWFAWYGFHPKSEIYKFEK